jgi:hypothetical protein
VVVALLGACFSVALINHAIKLAPRDIETNSTDTTPDYLNDFAVFYTAGELAGSGRAGTVYDIDTFDGERLARFGSEEGHATSNPYFNPPYFLLLLVPLAMLPAGMAATLWIGGGLLMLATILWRFAPLLAARMGAPGAVLVVLGMASSLPVAWTAWQGQFSFWLAGAWLLIWAGHFRGGSPWLTACGMALLALKPQMALVPGTYLLWQRDYRALAGFMVIESVLFGAGLLAFGPGVLMEWVALLLRAVGWEGEHGQFPAEMLGWNAFLRQALGPDFAVTRTVATTVLSAATLGGAVVALRRYRPEPHRVFALLVFATLVTGPHVYTQEGVQLIPALLVVLLCGAAQERRAWLAWSVAGWFAFAGLWDVFVVSNGAGQLNVVSLWLAASCAMAALGPERVAAMARQLAARWDGTSQAASQT